LLLLLLLLLLLRRIGAGLIGGSGRGVGRVSTICRCCVSTFGDDIRVPVSLHPVEQTVHCIHVGIIVILGSIEVVLVWRGNHFGSLVG